MKHDEFISKLVLRYPKLNDTRFQLQDIKDSIQPVSESILDELWEAFNSHYDRDTAPRWASINQAAIKAGVYLKSTARIKFWALRCENCGTYFSGHNSTVDGPKCTGCKKIYPATIIRLTKDENPYNLNQAEFGNPQGNIFWKAENAV